MKKIMFYINAIHDGGAERVMINLSARFAEDGYETILVTSFRDEWEYPVSEKVKRISLEDTEINQSKLRRNLSRIHKLRKLCKIEKPDVMVSFMAEPNFRAIISTIGLHTKTIISVRNDPNREYAGKGHRIAAKLLFPLADGCVFQTSDAQQWFSSGIQKKSTIIANAVKSSFFEIQREPKEYELVCCGRLTEQKNYSVLFRAFNKAKNEIPELMLKVYGEGEMRDQLQSEIIKMGLDGSIQLCGQTNDVETVLKHADVFILSSDYEGMPNSLLEAYVAGVPCISTDCPCGGPRMIIQNQQSGLLVPVKDEDSLSKAICDIYTKHNRQLISDTARRDAERFHPDRVFDVWKDYINGVCSKIEKG